ncbi:LOW QUALITY PROTEIN: ADP-ribosylglycohydrolase, partial [Streptomyces sviceus ATCC 29083]
SHPAGTRRRLRDGDDPGTRAARARGCVAGVAGPLSEGL